MKYIENFRELENLFDYSFSEYQGSFDELSKTFFLDRLRRDIYEISLIYKKTATEEIDYEVGQHWLSELVAHVNRRLGCGRVFAPESVESGYLTFKVKDEYWRLKLDDETIRNVCWSVFPVKTPDDVEPVER